MQDTDIPKNKVIIIGGDHHNGLGLARIFGINGKKVISVVISAKKRSWMATSKYVEHHVVCKTEKEGLDYILEKYSEETLKPFIIPYSDRAALELDLRLNQFKEKFYVPSINGEQGRIASLMDKDAQYKWAMEHGIKMAKSSTIDLNQFDFQKNDFEFPCILKPNCSVNGEKLDIVICQNQMDLQENLKILKEKGYTSIFLQDYLKIDYEIDAFGGIASCGKMSFFPHKIIRRWPQNTGTSSFTQVVVDDEVLSFGNTIISYLKSEGFQGLYDVEFFKIKNNFYLNEINFRNSGSGFRAISQCFFYAYDWFCNTLKGDNCEIVLSYPKKKLYTMTEYTDVRYLRKGASLFGWIKDLMKSKSFALVKRSDMKPFFFKIIYRI